MRALIFVTSPAGADAHQRYRYEQRKRAVMAGGEGVGAGGPVLEEAPSERALLASVVDDVTNMLRDFGDKFAPSAHSPRSCFTGSKLGCMPALRTRQQ